MNKFLLYLTSLVGLLLLTVSCGDDDYHYPSVELSFVTVTAGDDGYIQSLLPDEGELLTVTQDRTNSMITPNTSSRVLSNYATVKDGNQNGAVIYSLQSLFVADPKLPSDPSFDDGLKYDPVNLVSIWQGRNYLNLILNTKVDIDSGKKQIFDIIEESVTSDAAGKVVNLSLYYDRNGENEYYNRKLYMSIPLIKYVDEANPNQKITINFKYHTYDDSGAVIESDKYCNPGFTYVPYE